MCRGDRVFADPAWLANPALRGPFAVLVLVARGRSEIVAPAGRTLADVAAPALGIDAADAAALLEQLEAAELIAVEGDVARLLPCGPTSAPRPRGGSATKATLSNADRQARWRARHTEQASAARNARRNGGRNDAVTNEGVTEPPCGGPVNTETTAETPVVTTDPVTRNGGRNAIAVTGSVTVIVDGAAPSPAPALPLSHSPSLSPVAPPSPPSPTAGARGAGAEFALAAPAANEAPAKRKGKRGAAARPDVIPPEGSPAWRLWDVITRSEDLARITTNPGVYATIVSDPRRFPGVDLVKVALGAVEYLSRGEHSYSDGRRFLNSQFDREAKLVAARGSANTTRITPRSSAPARGYTPAATAEDFARERGNAPVDTSKPISHGWPVRKAAP